MLHHATIYIYLHDWVTFDVKVGKSSIPGAYSGMKQFLIQTLFFLFRFDLEWTTGLSMGLLPGGLNPPFDELLFL